MWNEHEYVHNLHVAPVIYSEVIPRPVGLSDRGSTPTLCNYGAGNIISTNVYHNYVWCTAFTPPKGWYTSTTSIVSLAFAILMYGEFLTYCGSHRRYHCISNYRSQICLTFLFNTCIWWSIVDGNSGKGTFRHTHFRCHQTLVTSEVCIT